ncbi:hypothetical protein [Pseudonocardia sp. MH-G8]|uniref:hypothetical protein n=1 Tax=Pseudonocardia sp. MH-G8 TaxID=1854588 RepID=UPI000BA0457C|nr:hypothetical protein [Pseudonocardia sp. MH-G8]OZM78777.1 hypothetical protein CFP66_29515 [Pseudonocardia sp. MH-G8]
MLSRILRNGPLRRIAVVVLLVLLYQGWLGVQAIGKADPSVGADPDDRGRFPVDVVLDFPPERYHVLELQKHGRVAGTDGMVVHLRGVSPAGLDALAREYWIEGLTTPTGAAEP